MYNEQKLLTNTYSYVKKSRRIKVINETLKFSLYFEIIASDHMTRVVLENKLMALFCLPVYILIQDKLYKIVK